VGRDEGLLFALEAPDLLPEKARAVRAALLELSRAYEPIDGHVEHRE